VADALGEPRDGTNDGTRAVRAMRRILAELDFPVLSSLDLTAADLDHLADLALEDFFITQAPEPWSKDEVVAAFTAALALESRAA
jgi:alcohol dehydrogenase